jgi:hypothetical protein
LRQIRSLVRHTHIEDVKGARRHETCLRGDGVVNVAACLKVLRTLQKTCSGGSLILAATPFAVRSSASVSYSLSS